jgi:hypothetical protein
MLDRAITLYLRRFASIVTVLAVVAVPLTVVQTLIDHQSAHVFSDVARMISAGSGTAESRKAAEALALDGQANPGTFAFVFVAGFVRLLTWVALVAVVAAAYAGARTSLADAYRLALRRWPAQLVIAMAFLILAIFAAIPVFMLYMVVAIVAIGMTALKLTAVAFGVMIVGFLLILAVVAVGGSLILMSYELSAVAAVTETRNPVEAIGIGLRRAFGRGMKRRTVAAGLIVMLVSQAGTLPLIGVAVLATMLTRIDALYFAILGAGGILLNGIVATFVVVYAVDARVRREGYDLIAAEQPAVTA